MSRQIVRPTGLRKHLGEDIRLTKEGDGPEKSQIGRLVFYPNNFAFMSDGAEGDVVPISEGDLVGLRHNYPITCGREGIYLRDYVVKFSI
jgi:hypothetical protein